MQSWQIFGVGILIALAAVVIRQIRADMVFPVRLAGGIILLGAVVSMSIPLYEYIDSLISSTAMSEYGGVLTKALGVAILTHISSEICKDCGEATVASTVELAGKCEILLLSISPISSILRTASDILNWQM